MRAITPVFLVSAGLATVFVLCAVAFTAPMSQLVAQIQDLIVTRFGWFYILSVSGFLIFVLWLFFSRHGAVKLGADDDEPEYSYPTWFAMLFSAGMGIGLLFYGVAEPVLHFGNPRLGAGGTIEAAKAAMNTAFFHWGLHAWAIYIVVGLALAYFGYRHNLPLTIRSTLYPILGDRVNGPIGYAVDVMAILGTLFGVATSLGLGVMQVNAGLNYLDVLDISLGNQIWLIVGITLIATVSVVTGLDYGIRRLSEINVLLAILLLAFVFLAGPTVFLLSTFVESVGHYVQTLIDASFRTTAFRGIEWQKGWTMFYWGWWISWAPFVGMFIARISRGRTIREFIGGVLFAPVLFTFFWFTVLGNTALHIELFGAGGMVSAVSDNVATALFVMLNQLPWATITSVIATVMVVTFFVTSSDSGSLVIDMISSNGDPDPPVWKRVFWALSEGAVAIVLLLVGGLGALQTAAIATALPFSAIMVLMCVALVLSLREENALSVVATSSLPPIVDAPQPVVNGIDWRARLAQIMGRPRRAGPGESPLAAARRRVADFIREVALPAFADAESELRRHGRQVTVEQHPYHTTLRVRVNNTEEFFYSVRGRAVQPGVFSMAEAQRPVSPPEPPHVEIVVRGGLRRAYALESVSREWLTEDFIAEYSKWMGW